MCRVLGFGCCDESAHLELFLYLAHSHCANWWAGGDPVDGQYDVTVESSATRLLE